MLTKTGLVTAVAILAALPILPGPVAAQKTGVEIWSATCGSCHALPAPSRYYAKDWRSISQHMTITARLTSEQSRLVRAFLLSGARQVDAAPGTDAAASAAAAVEDRSSAPSLMARFSGGWIRPPAAQARFGAPDEDYKKLCVPCHGENGKGDGPAAIAFKPPPKDLTNRESLKELTDEQLVEVLSTGKGNMPAFGALLAPEQVQALVTYVRALSNK